MITLVLVRHAQPDWEPGGRAVDFPGLTAHGRRQAQALAEHFALEPRFDVCLTSTLRRAIETAEPIGRRLRSEFEQCSWLDELRLPALEGSTVAEVEHFFASQRARDLEKWWDGSPGGETFRHLYERVSGGVESLLSAQHGLGLHANSGFRLWRLPERDLRLLIVAHEGSISVILSHLLGIEPVPFAFVRFGSAWSGVSRIESVPVADGAVFALRAFNRVDHLAALGTPPGGRHG